MPDFRTADETMELFIVLVNLIVILSVAIYLCLLCLKDDNRDDNQDE
jgi:hypothetical protein